MALRTMRLAIWTGSHGDPGPGPHQISVNAFPFSADQEHTGHRHMRYRNYYISYMSVSLIPRKNELIDILDMQCRKESADPIMSDSCHLSSLDATLCAKPMTYLPLQAALPVE
jgi:hypothetical protein